MKKIPVLFITLSVLVILSACSLSPKPKVSLCLKGEGTLSAGENRYKVSFDFSGEKKTVVLHSKQNPFDLRYSFEKDTVRIDYDDLHSTLAVGDLPKGNVACVLWRVGGALSLENAKWDSESRKFLVKSKAGALAFSAVVNERGQIEKILVPEFDLEWKK